MRFRLVTFIILVAVIRVAALNAQNRHYLPHIATGTHSGGSYRTTFILFNNNNASVNGTLRLTGNDGTPLSVTIPGLGSGSQFSINLSAGASRVLQTDGLGGLVGGAAVIDASSRIGVSSIFTLYDTSGAYQTEAGVGSSELLSEFVFPVDVGGVFNTGLALFNGGTTATANIALSLINTNGQTVMTATRSLAGNAHLATFVAGSGQLFPTVTTFRGTLLVQSSVPVTALVLRQNLAPLSYTSLPVVSRTSNRTVLNLAHVANGFFDGGSFKTSFLIFNLSSSAVTATLALTRDDGSPLTVTIPGRGSGSSFTLSLSPGGAVFLETDGSGPLAGGAAVVTGSGAIGASAIFTVFDAQGNFETEAGFADSAALTTSTLPVDVTGGGDTGVAFFNQGAATATVMLRLLDADGAIASPDVPLTLAPRNHVARFVSSLFPGVTNFRGVLTISANPGVASLTLRQNSGPSYTTLPVVSGSAPGTAIVTASGPGINMSLAAGSYWEFFWISETKNFAQGSGTTYDVRVGRFRVTLGAPRTIAGQTAYSVAISGDSTDGTTNFAPEWTYLSVSSNGSLMGSANGTSLTSLYSADTTTWTGGGFFVPFPATQPVTAAAATFPGEYNQTSGISVGRQVSSGGCTYYESVGQVCAGDPRSISEREYYKSGVGPIGYKFTSTQTFSGGGFTTSNTRTQTVELIATSLRATDGTVFRPPPWQEMKPMNTRRTRHAAVVLNGKIYVLGGISESNTTLSSVEIYDPATDTWSAGTPLPAAMSYHTAEVVGGRIYVIPSNGTAVRIFNPATNSWTTGAVAPYNDPAHGSCTMLNDYVVIATPDGAFNGRLEVPFYQVSINSWNGGVNYTTSDRRWFSVACLDTDLYLIGGYRQFLPSSNRVDNSILRYHAEAPAAWTAIAPRMSQARYAASSVAFNGEILAIGGQDESQEFRSIEAYSPASAGWRAFPAMLRPRRDFDSVVLNGMIYVIGGKSGSATLSHVERYAP